MVPPTTANLDGGLNVLITWTAPYSHVTKPITAYTIIIKDSLGVYRQHANCDGTDTTIVSQMQCTVTMSSLRLAPFSLSTLGTLI